MFFWSIQVTIISIILIFLVQHLFLFLKQTLTVPKIKDLVNAPAQKYEHMYQTMSAGSYSNNNNNNNNSNNNYNNNNNDNNTTNISQIDASQFLPSKDYTEAPLKPDVNSMKNELKSFLKSQQVKGANANKTTDISALETVSNFSPY